MTQLREIDDGQPVEAERRRVVAPHPAVVRAAVALPLDRRVEVGAECAAGTAGVT